MSVRATINVISACGLLMFTSYFLLSLFYSNQKSKSLENLQIHQLPTLLKINNSSLNLLEVEEFLSSAIISSELSRVQEAEKYSKEIVKDLQFLIDLDNDFSKPAKSLVNSYSNYWISAKTLAENMISGNGDYEESLALSRKVKVQYAQVKEGISNLRNKVISSFSNTVTQTNADMDEEFYFGLLIGMIFLMLSIIVTQWAASKFKAPLRILTQHADDIANGHYDKDIDVLTQDEFGQLAIAFNNMTNNQNRLLQDLEKSRDKVQNALEAKALFLANMSHEIRTPISGVIGMLDLIKDSPLNEAQCHYLSLASSSAESLLVLINDLLDFSKLEAGKLEAEKIDFNIHDILGKVAESVAIKAQEKGLEVILDVVDIEMTNIKGDPGRLRQILSNLTSNAIKFTQEGEVLIQLKVEDADDNTLKLLGRVQDTGIGIPEDKIGLLFRDFSQVDASTTRKYGGTGLGLTIVKQLCNQFGGDVSVDSTFGEGSCFSFNLLLEKSPHAQRVKPAERAKSTRILIVDDNLTTLSVLRRQLEKWNFDVILETSGTAALARLQDKEKPNINAVMLDAHMPILDGIQLGKNIRSKSKFDALNIIIMTTMYERGSTDYFSNLGFQGFFPKPATTDDLLNACSIIVNTKGMNTETSVATMQENLPANNSSLSGRKVLLVEDNEINQVIAEGMLQDIGINPVVAENGKVALMHLEKTHFDLVLMDCQMPIMDGYEATRIIRSRHTAYQNIPIIAMTANAVLGDKEKCIKIGMSDYLSKPVDPDEFNKKLFAWLSSEQ